MPLKNRKIANLIILGCFSCILMIFAALLLFQPLMFYGMLAMLGVGIIYGSIMNRRMIRLQVDQVLAEYRIRQLKDSASSSGSGTRGRNN